MAKIHPHLKAFIRGIILTELDVHIGNTPKQQIWKEEVLSNCIEKLVSMANSLNEQNEYEEHIEALGEQLRKDLNVLVDSIVVSLKGIPLTVIKQVAFSMNPNKRTNGV